VCAAVTHACFGLSTDFRRSLVFTIGASTEEGCRSARVEANNEIQRYRTWLLKHQIAESIAAKLQRRSYCGN
jgi:hypothetical protein